MEKILSLSVVVLPVAPTYGCISASTILPTLSVPFPSCSSYVMGARSTATTSPISCEKSASGPPSLPVQTSTSAFCWSSLALSSTTMATFQLPLRTFPGRCASKTRLRPVTSVPFTVPLSKWYPTTASHVPLSGSSPIQQGHSTSQLQTSRMLPSSEYAIRTPPMGEKNRGLSYMERSE